MGTYLILDEEYSSFSEREKSLAPGYEAFSGEARGMAFNVPIILTGKNADGTYTLPRTGDKILPDVSYWYVAVGYDGETYKDIYSAITLSGETVEIHYYGNTLEAKPAYFKDGSFCGWWAADVWQGTWIYTGETTEQVELAMEAMMVCVQEEISYSPGQIFSIKPGVEYSMDNRKVLYNRPKGYYMTLTYFVTISGIPVPIFAGEGLEELLSIEIDGKLISREDLHYEADGWGMCTYQFDSVGYHVIVYRFRESDVNTMGLFNIGGEGGGRGAMLISAEIEKGITSIPENCFSRNYALTSVTLPSTLRTIGHYAFTNCYLNDIFIPGSVKGIGIEAFGSNTNLTGFSGGTGLEYVGSRAFNYAPVSASFETYGNILYIGDKIAYATVDKFSTNYTLKSGTTCIVGECFYNCNNVTSITIPNTVKRIGPSAFNSCSSLKEITIPDNVETPGDEDPMGEGSWGMFYYCTTLTSATIGSGVTRLDGSFFESCYSLGSITIGPNITEIQNSVFRKCSSLTSVTFEGNGIEAFYDSVFEGCSSLSSITIPNGVKYLGQKCFSGAGITALTIPASVEEIRAYCFGACRNLSSMTIPDTVKRVGLPYLFSGCTNLTSVTLPISANTEVSGSSTPYEYFTATGTFRACNKLTGVTLPYIVSGIGESCFDGCYALSSLTFSENVKSVGRLAFGSSMSFGTSLTSVTFMTDSFTSFGEQAFAYRVGLVAFYGPLASSDHRCLMSGTTLLAFATSGLSNYTVPEGVTAIAGYAFLDSSLNGITLPNSLKTIGNYTFMYSDIKDITIPDSVTELGSNVFRSTLLTGVTLGSGLTALPNSAFCESGKIVTVTIPDTIATIGTGCFGKCSGLTNIILGSGLTSFSSNVFSGCTVLSSITCTAPTAPTISSTTFRAIRRNGTLKYPQGSDYSAWLASGNYYLGSYGWTGTPITS